METQTPGNKPQTFQIVLGESYFPPELLHQRNLEIISYPKEKYRHWRWRLLEFLTLGKKFRHGWEYTVREKQHQNNRLFQGICQ